MKKVVVIIIIVLILGGGVIWKMKKSKSGTAEEAAKQDKIMKVERGQIRQIVSTTGSIVTLRDVEIKCKASGQVVGLPYDISDKVEKDDLLVELDPVDENRNVKQAKIKLSSSESRLAQAQEKLKIQEQQVKKDRTTAEADLRSIDVDLKDKQQKFERKKNLYEQKMISAEEFETAKTSVDVAQANFEKAKIRLSEIDLSDQSLELLKQDLKLAKVQVEYDKIALEQAEQRLKDTKAFAPISGVVTARTVELGQIVTSPTNNVSGGTSLMTISDLSRLFINASVDESDIGKIQLDQRVEVSVDAYPLEKFYGKVVRIATQGQNVSNVVTFDVKIEILSENKAKLKPKMTTNVDIVVADKQDALLISSDAIKTSGIKSYVLLKPGSETAKKYEGKTNEEEVTKALAAQGRSMGGFGSGRRGDWSRFRRDGSGAPGTGEGRPDFSRFRQNSEGGQQAAGGEGGRPDFSKFRRSAEGGEGQNTGIGEDGTTSSTERNHVAESSHSETGEKKPASDEKKSESTDKKAGASAGTDTVKKEEGNRRYVLIGITDGQKVEILSGLEEGDETFISASDFQSKWSRPATEPGRPGDQRQQQGMSSRGMRQMGMGGGGR